MKNKLMNKKGNMIVNIFMFMIIAVIVVFISIVFIYMSGEVRTKLHEKLDPMTEPNATANYTELIDEHIGAVDSAYASLRWISVFLILGMIIAIFIHAYFVTYHPVFFASYIFIAIIAIIVAVGIAQGYEILMEDATLSPTIEGFLGANFIILNLPIWMAIIGIGGGIVMMIRLSNRREEGGQGF